MTGQVAGVNRGREEMQHCYRKSGQAAGRGDRYQEGRTGGLKREQVEAQGQTVEHLDRKKGIEDRRFLNGGRRSERGQVKFAGEVDRPL